MRNIKVIFLSFVLFMARLLVCGQEVDAQDALGRLQQKEFSGKVNIILDSLILENYNKHLLSNSRNRGVEGFRIRIFSDNGQGAKDNQLRVSARFLSLFPDIPVYYRYEGSYYKIYIGDFRTKRDALKGLNMIRKEFPDAFIVEDKITIRE